jgi:LPXTG-motif cell wall-anchored protein
MFLRSKFKDQTTKRYLVKHWLGFFVFSFSITLVLLYSITMPVRASDAAFTVTPETGYVKVGENFTIDILIDSDGDDIALARAVLTMDPAKVKIIKAEKNAAIFCNWPDDEQTIDNANGVIMVTAFCQSGADDLYNTVGEPDVFTRLTFQALKPGALDFEWQWTGEDVAFKSVIMKDGSPTQNVLTSQPEDFEFIATKVLNSGSQGTPNTGEFGNEPYVVAGIVFLSSALIFGGSYLILFANRKKINNSFKTLVIYDEE